MKRKTLEQKGYRALINVLDRAYSEYIRLKYSNDNGLCICITCKHWHHWSDIHNGHYINRDVIATRYDERNCRPQCVACNKYHSGKAYFFRQELVGIYGEDVVNDIERIANMGGNFDTWQLREMIVDYRKKVKELKKEKVSY